MRITKTLLVVLIVVSFFIPAQSAHADIAPPPAPQLGGLEPFEYQETNVQMVYERVEMEVQSFLYPGEDSFFPNNRVNVTAYFTMHNQGNLSESMQVIFPLESFTNCEEGVSMGNSYTYYQVNQDSFNVVIDGNNISIQKVVTEHPRNGCPQMTWASFDVTFPVDEDVVIQVSYVMESLGGDYMQNIEYILETGAGWAGPIQRGYVIVKFPYTATTENVLSESTPGYQFLYNEIFWSFENLEPTRQNNIQVSIVSPNIWQDILSLRRELKENPGLPEKWLELSQTYIGISTWHGDNLRSDEYFQKTFTAFEQGIAENPNNAELPVRYAQFKLYNLSPRLIRQLTNDEAAQVLLLLNKALALEPKNETAQMTLSELKSVASFITFTPPPTVPPTATSLFTSTPSITPSATITPIPSETPVVVTVIHTKIVNAPTSTQVPQLTATLVPTENDNQNETQRESNSSTMIFGVLVVFAVGIGVGLFWSTRTKR